MACNTCITVCPIAPCYSYIWVGNVGLSSGPQPEHTVEIENIATGKKVRQTVTPDPAGYVVLDATSTDWTNFFNSNSEFRFKIYLKDKRVGHSWNNVPVDFTVITDFDVTANYFAPISHSTNEYDCVIVSFTMTYDNDNAAMEILDQYLLNADA